MPELKRNHWSWPRPANVNLRAWFPAEYTMANGIWEGRSYVLGRAPAFGEPALSDGHEWRRGELGWHPDHPITLQHGHDDGDILGTAVWAEEFDDGLWVLWQVRDEHLTTLFCSAGDGQMDLSVGGERTLDTLDRKSRLDHVALAPVGEFGDVPGSQVFAFATPWDVYVRSAGDEMVHAGNGPAAYAPTPSIADMLDGAIATRSATELYLPLNRLEVRHARNGGRPTMSGICVPYDSRTHKAGATPELFRLGAFSADANEPGKVRLYANNHDKAARPAGVAVKLTERRDGLHGEFEFYDTPRGREAWEEAREGVYGGLSVGFIPVRERNVNGTREILGARLHHVSLVDEPAYDGARIYGVTPADIAPRVTPKTDELVPA